MKTCEKWGLLSVLCIIISAACFGFAWGSLSRKAEMLKQCECPAKASYLFGGK